MTELELRVTRELGLKGKMTRFELVDEIPLLNRRTSASVLRDMEGKGLITSRLETRDTPHRLYERA